MCKNANAQLGNALKAIEPTLVQFENVIGVAKTPEGVAAISAFNALQTSLTNWQPGDDDTIAIEAVNTFDNVFQTLPVPSEAKALAGVIAAGVDVILGVLEANKPTPAIATPPVAQQGIMGSVDIPTGLEAHQKEALAKAVAKVQAKVPGYKISTADRVRASMGDHHVIAREYTAHWNKTVDQSDPKYASLKIA